MVREGAVAALRAALTVTSQRESKATQRSLWYKVSCYHRNNIKTVSYLMKLSRLIDLDGKNCSVQEPLLTFA